MGLLTEVIIVPSRLQVLLAQLGVGEIFFSIFETTSSFLWVTALLLSDYLIERLTMAPKSGDTLEAKSLSKSARSPSRSPRPKNRKKSSEATLHYGSDGVKENDIFSLPSSDYKTLAFLTLVAAIVRLFRIYQPSSVVFDEVQYISLILLSKIVSVSNFLCK